MSLKYSFKNIIGDFILDNDLKIIKSKDKDKTQEINEKDLPKILINFKDKKYFNKFYEENLRIIKKKLKESVGKDSLITKTISTIESLNKNINVLVGRLRDWYELYNPEFSYSIDNNEKFVELIVNNSDEKDKSSCGADLKEEDFTAIMNLAKGIYELILLRKKETEYLEKLMNELCPNTTIITGALLGAKLLEKGGSLKNLMEMPATKIQLLGAEKSLFRHMRNKNMRPPKHGIIIQHPLVSQAKLSKRGKAARLVADKISIALRVDYFKGEPIGEKLLKEIENKLK